MSHIQPVRIRPTDGDLIGTTAFFRNRAFLFHFGEEIAKLSTPGRPVEIFVHACSIGAEVYSLAIYLQTVHPTVDFRITSTDISGGFVEYARAAEYPGQAVEALTEQERSCFNAVSETVVRVNDSVRARVQFIQPASFVDCDPGRTFDVVSLCNGLMYVQAPGQAQAIDRISGYNSALLAVTGGHPDTIATDLTRNGYAPILSGLHDIHNGWTDRIRPPSWPKGAPLPHNIHCDPFLDAIDDQPGWQYRFGALFQKEPAA